jgi:hypothetical protein
MFQRHNAFFSGVIACDLKGQIVGFGPRVHQKDGPALARAKHNGGLIPALTRTLEQGGGGGDTDCSQQAGSGTLPVGEAGMRSTNAWM